MDISKKRGGGFLVLLADGEVEVFELLVEGLGLRGVRTLDFDEVVDVEAEGTDLAAKLVGRLGPVLLADVLTNILVDASHRLRRARRGFLLRKLLEREAGRAIGSRLLVQFQVTSLVDELQPGLVLHALVRELDARRRERGRGRAQDDRRDGGEGHSLVRRGLDDRVRLDGLRGGDLLGVAVLVAALRAAFS